MEYEENYEPQVFNYRLLTLLCVCALLFGIFIYPVLFKNKPEPIKVIQENKSNAIQIEYITILVTPTPDGKIYFASEYQSGIRKIQRPFSFIREKTSGLKNTVVHAIVYDYREMNYYTWFNPTEYKYYRQYPIGDSNKFMFIFYNIYLDDITGDDSRLWITTEKQMNLQIKDVVYSPINYPKQIRIKELENTYNYNDDKRVSAYNSQTVYSSSSEYRNTAGEYSQSIDVLKGGKSNAIDGYIIFEIPKDSKDEDILFAVNYDSFGQSFWRLKSD